MSDSDESPQLRRTSKRRTGRSRPSALDEIREAREHGLRRIDQVDLEDDEDDNIYDVVDEDQYRALVQQRREKGDFVVDDDGTGYMDDGEEHYWEKHSDGSDVEADTKQDTKKKKRRGKHHRMPEHDGSNQKVSAMFLKYNQQKAAPSTGPSVGPNSKRDNNASTRKEREAEDKIMNDSSLDDMLKDLVSGSAAASSSSKKNKRKRHTKPKPVKKVKKQTQHDAAPSRHDTSEQTQDSHDEDDSAPMQLDDDDEGNAAAAAAKEPSTTGETQEESTDSLKSHPEGASQESAAPLSAKAMLLQRARKRPVKQLPLPPKPSTKVEADTVSANGIITKTLTSDPSWDQLVSGQQNQQTNTNATTTTTTSGGSANSAPLPVEKDEEGEDTLVMYWMDMYEDAYNAKGVVYVIGKVYDEATKEYSSCCVKVTNLDRVMYVLPRETHAKTGEPVEFPQVYQEIRGVVNGVVPAGAGREFRCKQVDRDYAFEMPGVPRGKNKYLKVKYPMCNEKKGFVNSAGGDTYSHIFGTRQSAIERMLLSRDLMGPCWLSITGFEKTESAVSWCRYEVTLDDPKAMVKLTTPRAIPPLKVMSLSLKTIVNRSTHAHEIVIASAFMKERYPLEGAQAKDLESAQDVKYFTAVRAPDKHVLPNGQLATMPRDMKQRVANDPKLRGHISIQVNERALLGYFIAQIHRLDPDVILGHNIAGFELDVLMSRMNANKIPFWSKIGRLKRTRMPKGRVKNGGVESYGSNLTPGRLLLDSYLTARELLFGQRSYTLTELCRTRLNVNRQEVDPQDVPQYYASANSLVSLIQNNDMDAWLTYRLAVKLEALPLTLQLTTLGGNLWRRTLSGGRAERIEYLLLHEFHRRKFILPDKESYSQEKRNAEKKQSRSQRKKPSYAGGLVLEPKKGLYDKFILLLDFNSLYPSIIQEYNICYTTVERGGEGGGEAQQVNDMDCDGDADLGEKLLSSSNGEFQIPPLPDRSVHKELAVLPTLIKSLVERRREVKNLMKKEKNPSKRQQLDVRQLALKITANSMYGCLGFSNSRFFAKPLAALVTSQGRDILQNTVDTAQNKLNLEVIYGDTDSIMINTASTDLVKVKEIAGSVKREINKMYKLLELEMDGIFKSMLLLKKKKYAALTIKETRAPNGEVVITTEKETKGLDLVRRDWCPLSRSVGHSVLDLILSGKTCDEVVEGIYAIMSDLGTRVKGEKVDLKEFVVTKGLNKSPKDYPNAKGQPHLNVAMAMLRAGKAVNTGDHIPYVICTISRKDFDKLKVEDDTKTTGDQPNANPALKATTSQQGSFAERAFHPEEIERANGKLVVDYEWYLVQQILPPIQRLCEPIEEITPAGLADKLGVDSSKFRSFTKSYGGDGDDLLINMAEADDSERFKHCDRVKIHCAGCGLNYDLPGVYWTPDEMAAMVKTKLEGVEKNGTKKNVKIEGEPTNVNGNNIDNKKEGAQQQEPITNPSKENNNKAAMELINKLQSNVKPMVDSNLTKSGMECPCCNEKIDLSFLHNVVLMSARRSIERYYQNWNITDDPSCDLRTRQQSVRSNHWVMNGRRVKLQPEYSAKALYTQLRYLESLVDVSRANTRLKKENDHRMEMKRPLVTMSALDAPTKEQLASIQGMLKRNYLDNSAYCWIKPAIFQQVFKAF